MALTTSGRPPSLGRWAAAVVHSGCGGNLGLVRRARHGHDVQGGVQLLFGQFAALQEAHGHHGLADGQALGHGLLGDLGGVLVADELVQRRDDGRRGLGEEAGALDVGGDAVDHLVGHDAAGVGQQAHGLEQVGGHDGDADVQLEGAVGAGPGDGGVVADDLGADHDGGFADDRVDLAGHDRGARLQVRDGDFAEAGVGAGAHPAEVVVDLHEGDRDVAQLAGGFDQAVAVGLGLEVVAGLGQRQAGVGGEQFDDALREAGRGVDAGADGGAAERNFGDAGEGGVDALDAVADLRGVAAELLAQGHRGGVHQVRAAGLHDVLELDGLALQRLGQVAEGRDQVVDQGGRGGDVDRRGEDVVGGLRGVDVVVRVDHLVAAGGLEGAGGELGDDLVGVHVRGRAGAGLEDVDREVAVVLAGGNLVGGVGNRLGELAVEHSQFCVGLGGGLLDPGEGLDVGALQGLAGDREVLDCTLRLGAVQGVHGDADFAHRVVFNAELFGVQLSVEVMGLAYWAEASAPKTVNGLLRPAGAGGLELADSGNEVGPAVSEAVGEPDHGGPAALDCVRNHPGAVHEPLRGLLDVLDHHVVDLVLVVAQRGQHGRRDALDEAAHEADRHLAGFHGGLGGGDGAAAVVAQDHDQRHAQHADAVLQRAEHGVVDHLAGGADHEGVPEAQVEDDFGGEPGIGAAEDHGEGVLVLHQRGPAGGVLVRVRGFAGDETFVAFAQTAPGEGGSQVSGHGPTLRRGAGRG